MVSFVPIGNELSTHAHCITSLEIQKCYLRSPSQPFVLKPRNSSRLLMAAGHPNYSFTNSLWPRSMYVLFLFHYFNAQNFRQALGKETTKPNPYGLSRVRSTPSMSQGASVADKGSIVMANASGGSIDLASLLRTNEVEALHTTVICAPAKYLVWTRLSNDNLSWIIK